VRYSPPPSTTSYHRSSNAIPAHSIVVVVVRSMLMFAFSSPLSDHNTESTPYRPRRRRRRRRLLWYIVVVVTECSLATCGSVCRPLLRRKRRGFVSYINRRRRRQFSAVSLSHSFSLSLSLSIFLFFSLSLSLFLHQPSLVEACPEEFIALAPGNIENRQTNDCIIIYYTVCIFTFNTYTYCIGLLYLYYRYDYNNYNITVHGFNTVCCQSYPKTIFLSLELLIIYLRINTLSSVFFSFFERSSELKTNFIIYYPHSRIIVIYTRV